MLWSIMGNGSLRVDAGTMINRNFEGREERYNTAGRKNFTLLIDDPACIESLKHEGWNVNTRVYDEGTTDERTIGYLNVAVAFTNYPPKIVMITGNRKNELDEDSVAILDGSEIETVDMVIRPYHWEMKNGQSGVKAYLKTMYVTIREDEFADKYRDTADFGNDDSGMPFDL